MKNKAFFREIFDKVQEFLHLCMYEHDKIRLPLPDDFEERIARLEKTLEELNETSQELMRSVGMDQDSIQDITEQPAQLDDESWAYVQDIRKTRTRALAYRRRVQQSLKALRQKGIGLDGEDSEEAQKKARKRAFDRLGSRKNWRPI